MKPIYGNYLTQPNKDFPADCEMFDYLQTDMHIVSIIGNLAGDKAILLGCEFRDGGTQRAEGYVFLRTNDHPEGEVLFWEGGAVGSGMYLKQETIAVSALGYEYPQAYTVRTLAPGVGSEKYSWNEMRSIKTIPELEQLITNLRTEMQTLTPPPLGLVQIWAGKTVPPDYELCEGQQFKTTDYPALYAALGTTYNSSYDYTGKRLSTAPGYFRLPDLRGRFIAGYNVNDSEYSTYGQTGGEKKHILSTAELPAHTHGQNLWEGASGRWKGGGNNSWPDATTHHDRTIPFGSTASTGSNGAHENRPPYYTLAYIMRVK